MAFKLMKADIPGASLAMHTPEALKITELKFWLQCCGVSGFSKLKAKRNYVQRLMQRLGLVSYVC